MSEEIQTADEWRALALQFDAQRMQALALLRWLLDEPPTATLLDVQEFIAATPLLGSRIAVDAARYAWLRNAWASPVTLDAVIDNAIAAGLLPASSMGPVEMRPQGGNLREILWGRS